MQQNFDIAPAFRTLNIIYMALGMGMITAAGVFYFMVETNGASGMDASTVQIFTMIVPIEAVMCIGIGRFMFNKGAEKSKAETDLQKKFNLFQTYNIIVWALIEGSALFSLVSYLLIGDPLFLVFFAMIFAVFIFSKPSITKFQQQF